MTRLPADKKKGTEKKSTQVALKIMRQEKERGNIIERIASLTLMPFLTLEQVILKMAKIIFTFLQNHWILKTTLLGHLQGTEE